MLGLVDGLVEGRVLGRVLGRGDGLEEGLEAGLARDPVIGVRWLLEARDGLDDRDEELRPPPPRPPPPPPPRPPPRASNIGIAMSVVAMSHDNCLLQTFFRLSFIFLL